jgi:hypothetical protein
MCLEASTKPHVHKKIHEFLINMAFTMACQNFKKGLKMAFGPLGIKYKTYKHGMKLLLTLNLATLYLDKYQSLYF